MTLNQACIICGINILPTLSEGTKPQISLELLDLPKVKGQKDKTTGDVPMVHQSISLRALSSINNFLAKTGRDQSYYENVCEDWLESLNVKLFELVKQKGESPLALHKGLTELVDGMSEEAETASAADPDNIMARFYAVSIGKTTQLEEYVAEDGTTQQREITVHEPVGENAEQLREQMTGYFQNWISSDTNLDAMLVFIKKMVEKNGRTDNGQIKSKAAPKKKEETPATV